MGYGALCSTTLSICVVSARGSYTSNFMKHKRRSKLELGKKTYLKKTTNHRLLYSNQYKYLESLLNFSYPFFFSDERRTYFVLV